MPPPASVNPPRQVLAILLIAGLVTPLPAPAAKTPAPQMDDAKRVSHVLNRLAFGPRPGEIEQVRAMGVDKWIDLQLHPEKIDDSALEARLAPYRTLQMNSKQLVENFPPPQVVKQIAEGKRPMPSDPKKRAIYESQVAAYKMRQERKAETGDATGKDKQGDKAINALFDDLEAGSRRKEVMSQVDDLLKLEPKPRFDAILKMPADERRVLARALPPEKREQLMTGFTPDQREQLQAMAQPQQVVFSELASGKLLRATYSDRQLEEVMTDFWFNHFNVFVNKGADRYLTAAYERDVIRKHAFGKFEDLLVATAKSPAMLFYLDNFQSVGPDSPAGRGEVGRRGGRGGRFTPSGRVRFPGDVMTMPRPQARPQQQQQKRPQRGLNENYARELMELHTLGVDGGYTQKDVTEVAKVFTGWTIDKPQQGGNYEFREQLHEPGTKNVLGKKIHEKGESEGREVLHILATHPSTAHFISKKLAMRFVSDDPPKALVDRMASTFLKSKGDIREVLRTLFKSPEFWAPDAYRAKVKTPLEFVVSALRTTGAEVSDSQQLIQSLQKMGMPLYGMQPPTGYSMKAETWVNSSALIDRMNFSLALAAGRMKGVTVDPQRALGPEAMAEPSAELDRLTQALLAGDISPKTKETVEKEMGTTPNPAVIAGLLLGSPEFQRR
jgi:uncharacterized protein (DUF1800 family)